MPSSGDHEYIPGGAAYAAAVRARPGFALTRVLLAAPVPYQAGFALIAQHLAGIGRPITALCATELRVPQPLTLDGFAALNVGYGAELRARGLLQQDADGPQSPLARTNVAPLYAAPTAPALAAFCYTVPAAGAAAAFVVAGCGDIRDDDTVVAPGDTGPAGMRAKAAYIVDALDAALAALGLGWAAVTDLTVYSAHSADDLLGTVVYPRVGTPPASGVHLIAARPPIQGLDLELDARGVQTELRLRR